eukprot:2451445-Pyramimonas_sp.AAC.2
MHGRRQLRRARPRVRLRDRGDGHQLGGAGGGGAEAVLGRTSSGGRGCIVQPGLCSRGVEG